MWAACVLWVTCAVLCAMCVSGGWVCGKPLGHAHCTRQMHASICKAGGRCRRRCAALHRSASIAPRSRCAPRARACPRPQATRACRATRRAAAPPRTWRRWGRRPRGRRRSRAAARRVVFCRRGDDGDERRCGALRGASAARPMLPRCAAAGKRELACVHCRPQQHTGRSRHTCRPATAGASGAQRGARRSATAAAPPAPAHPHRPRGSAARHQQQSYQRAGCGTHCAHCSVPRSSPRRAVSEGSLSRGSS